MSPTVPPISHRTKSSSVMSALDEFLDRVGDVRDDLDGGAEIVAAALAPITVGIDPAGGDIVGFAARQRR